MNVFLVHTPFQLFIAEHMIGSLPTYGPEDSLAIVDGENLAVTDGSWSRVLRVDPPIGTSFIGNVRRLRTEVRRIEGVLPRDEDIRLHISNLDYPLANALYRAIRRRPGGTLLSYPEGILNVLPPALSRKKKLKNLLKSVYGAFAGLPFDRVGGDLSGASRAETVYSLIPLPSAPRPERIVVIPRPSLPLVGKQVRGAMICGQPLGDFLSLREYRQYTRRLIRRGRELADDGPVVYKPHPREPESFVSTLAGEGIRVVRGGGTAEQYFAESPVSHVVSFFSSALLHLKIFYHDDVTCVAYCPLELMSRSNGGRAYAERLLELFRRYGVEYSCPDTEPQQGAG